MNQIVVFIKFDVSKEFLTLILSCVDKNKVLFLVFYMNNYFILLLLFVNKQLFD